MTKAEKNKEIAKILGFVETLPKNNMGFSQWKYPSGWKEEIKSLPVTTVPDFITLMDQGRLIADMFRYGIPTEQD